jgi:hypothetical protein
MPYIAARLDSRFPRKSCRHSEQPGTTCAVMARSIELRYGLAFGSSWPLDTLGRRAPHCGGEIDAMGRPGVDIITTTLTSSVMGRYGHMVGGVAQS